MKFSEVLKHILTRSIINPDPRRWERGPVQPLTRCRQTGAPSVYGKCLDHNSEKCLVSITHILNEVERLREESNFIRTENAILREKLQSMFIFKH